MVIWILLQKAFVFICIFPLVNGNTEMLRSIQDCLQDRSNRYESESRHFWNCMENWLHILYGDKAKLITDADRKWFENLMIFKKLKTLRVRKEYRRLTEQERERYHTAIRILKTTPIGPTNRYDFIGLWHSPISIPLAHGGCGFLGWHRMYTLVYENALDDAVPGVTVPYFASCFDNAMPEAEQTKSIIWSDLFLGNGKGRVVSGPFSCWSTPTGPLRRHTGKTGSLFSFEGIKGIFKKRRTIDIVPPSTEFKCNIEDQHDGVHIWIGHTIGQIHDPKIASEDPVFFNHHAFVDLLWEIFQQLQKMNGTNPATDFPIDPSSTHVQAPNKPSLFWNLTNLDGYSDFYTKYVYRYEPMPTCKMSHPDCESDYLKCVLDDGEPHCKSKRIDEIFYKKRPIKKCSGKETVLQIPSLKQRDRFDDLSFL